MSRRFGLSLFYRAKRRMRDAFACPKCGLSTMVFNAGETLTFLPEKITAATHCKCPGGIVELTHQRGYAGVPRRHARFSMLHSDDQSVTIRDEGPWSYHPTVTSDPEWVVASMLTIIGKRRLFCLDPDHRLIELLIKKDRFAGFKPGPMDPLEIARLSRC
jgi:hypothetical protein